MNFQRGIDPKETLRIGRLYKAIRIESVEISLGKMDEYNPMWSYTEVFTGPEAHTLLKALENRKINWKIIISRNPEFLNNVGKEETLRFKVRFHEPWLMPFNGNIRPRNSLSLRKVSGKDLLYEGMLYRMSGKEKDI